MSEKSNKITLRMIVGIREVVIILIVTNFVQSMERLSEKVEEMMFQNYLVRIFIMKYE